ncbi:MAG TPA: pilus assembly protein TadG-related protein [Anaerolineae bacterium]|nr:pilus assembly protein TadG-related protein [Anaerolineae bacterium]HOQ99237.1 pilus assembly protein TadG-related protein [Anaerolineae bacterium]HPL28060.1 pilus assembly protein TadG-related protein [Anaerolineae bacterium]
MPRETHNEASERGQTLVLFALALVAMIGFLGLTIDGGNLYAERRLAQNAADAAALAGAYALGEGGDQRATYRRIEEYAVAKNGATAFSARYLPGNQPVADVAAGSPPGANAMQVTVRKEVKTFFMAALGISTVQVSAEAEAIVTQRPHECLGGCVMWAGQSINLDKNNGVYTGNVHSNGSLDLGKNNNVFNGICESVAPPIYDPHKTTFNPSAGNPRRVTPAGWPVEYNIADYDIDLGGQMATAAELDGRYHRYRTSMSLGGNNETLSGLYYVHGDCTVYGNKVHGKVTIVATGSIILKDNQYTMEAYSDGLLFFSEQGDITVEKNGASLRGIVYAPNGTISLEKNNSTLDRGGFVAQNIVILKNNTQLAYDADYCPGPKRLDVRLQR